MECAIALQRAFAAQHRLDAGDRCNVPRRPQRRLGEWNEDWIPTLRIDRVVTASGEVLFDASQGHLDRAVEDAVDMVNVEYLDVLIDLTGDDYMGSVTIG